MKKLLCLILILVLLFATGCNQAPPKPTEVPSETHIESETEIIWCEGARDYSYYTPFELLINPNGNYQHLHITDVIKATYLGTEKTEGRYYHNFEVTEVLRGLGVNTRLTVLSKPEKRGFRDKDTTFDTSVISYKKGTSYLLLLNRSYTAAEGVERFRSIDDSLILPLNDEGQIDIENAKLYGGQLLSHTSDSSLKEALTEGTFEKQLLEIIEKNLFILNFDVNNYEVSLIDSNLESIISLSPYIFEVTITDVDRVNNEFPYLTDIRLCGGKITKVYKAVDEISTDNIVINLHIDRVKKGEKYIFALCKNHWEIEPDPKHPSHPNYYFHLVRGNAMFDISEEETINKILENYVIPK